LLRLCNNRILRDWRFNQGAAELTRWSAALPFCHLGSGSIFGQVAPPDRRQIDLFFYEVEQHFRGRLNAGCSSRGNE
jgi:hypothetical protein